MKSSRKLIAAVVVTGLAITSSGTALAASRTTTITKTTTKKVVTSNPKVNPQAKGGPMGGGMGMGGMGMGGSDGEGGEDGEGDGNFWNLDHRRVAIGVAAFNVLKYETRCQRAQQICPH